MAGVGWAVTSFLGTVTRNVTSITAVPDLKLRTAISATKMPTGAIPTITMVKWSALVNQTIKASTVSIM